MSRISKSAFKIFIYLSACVAIIAALILFLFLSEVPDYKKLVDYQPIQMSRLYSSDGYLIDEYAKEKRLYVPLSSIPKHVIDAFLSAEDSNFYNHHGIDPVPILRAIYQNIFRVSQGKNIIGASTITQQVVKNILLTKERTLSRKIKEAILAIQISKVMSKDKILELYLNEIYLGYRSYGVAAAAINYFGKSLNQLTIDEAAFLATLPKAPTSLDPRKNYSKVLTRRNWVLSRMEQDGAISKVEYETSIIKPILVVDFVEQNTVQAGAFSEEIRKQSEEILGSNKIFTDGLFIQGTLDSYFQNSARESLQWGLQKYDTRRGYRGPYKKISLTEETDTVIENADLITDTSINNDSISDFINSLNEQNEINEITDKFDDKSEPKEIWAEQLKELKKPNEMKWQDWHFAVVLETEIQETVIGLEDETKGIIRTKDIAWARSVIRTEDLENGGYKDEWSEEISDSSQVFEPGDVIIVQKSKNYPDRYYLRQIPEINGAMVVMNVHDGRVLAMVGGYNDSKTEFNRATQAYRQPGSIVKPFTYLAALEKNFMPNNIIVDDEVRMKKEDGTSWIPKNYSGKFYGPTTMRIGLEKSRNVVTVRLAEMIGLDRIASLMERLDVVDNPAKNFSMVLGASESNLLKITSGYAMIANGGKKITPQFIEKIQDKNGNNIFKMDDYECNSCNYEPYSNDLDINIPNFEKPFEQIIDERSSYQMISLLEGVVKRGTGWRAKSLGKPIGGKTGTTNDSYDAWFIGFSSDIVVGVWVGYDSPRSLGDHETGSSVTLPIFVDAMKKMLNDENARAFKIPENIKFAKIDRLTGQKPTHNTNKQDIIFESFKSENYEKFQNSNETYNGESTKNNYETSIY
jgi:penicillin-binding protein 1A